MFHVPLVRHLSESPSGKGFVMQSFSLNEDMILNILQNARPYGHHEDAQRLNLGFGFIYYGLARVLRPKHVAVIGSGFGFSVICLALGLKDNGEGQVSFVDPSYSLLRNGPFKTIGGTDNWNEPTRVQEHFESFGVGNLVTHFKMTSEVFFKPVRGSRSSGRGHRLYRRQPFL